MSQRCFPECFLCVPAVFEVAGGIWGPLEEPIKEDKPVQSERQRGQWEEGN